MLVVDVGNTRIKWGLHDGSAWLVQEAAGRNELSRLAETVRQCRYDGPAVLSNVAGAAARMSVEALLNELGVASHWIQAQPQACGVRNGYARPGQLGSDRWAALVAAWNLQRAACVVASAGTALTVDALSRDGDFLGGFIIPGRNMMLSAIAAQTAGVADIVGSLTAFPASTGDAVHTGILTAMAGAVERMCRTLEQREGVSPVLMLTGGDAPVLQEALSSHGVIMDNLVLEGLLLIAEEMGI